MCSALTRTQSIESAARQKSCQQLAHLQVADTVFRHGVEVGLESTLAGSNHLV
jgi:hypothetical protein